MYAPTSSATSACSRRATSGRPAQTLPEPDLLLLSYTGCFTFMKWFELLRQEYDCPVAMLHVPYQADGKIHDHHRDYIVEQLQTEIIPKLEQVSGRKPTTRTCADGASKLSAQAEDDLVWVLESAKNSALADRRLLRRRLLHRSDLHRLPRHPEGVEYYRILRAEIDARVAAGLGPLTPDGDDGRGEATVWWSRGRPTGPASASSGRCSTTRARWWWPAATPRSAACTTAASGTIRQRPLETLADYCLGCYTNLSPAGARRPAAEVRRGVQRRRLPDQQRQELQLLQRRGSC